MTLEEIFSLVAEHMVEGLMFHSQMSDYYNFLGLKGYAECHKYHYFEENSNYRKLCEYYMTRFNKLIPERSFKNPNVIPENWYQFMRQDVDAAVRKAALKAGIDNWVKWEKDTKKLYETYYKELIALNEVAAALELRSYIIDVDEELATAQEKDIYLKAIDFDIFEVTSVQEKKHKYYKKKLKEIEL